MIYQITKNNLSLEETVLTAEAHNLIGIFTAKEWEEINPFPIPIYTDAIHFNKIEDMKTYIYGSFCLPIKDKYPANAKIRFYIYNSNLIFIDDKGIVQNLIEAIKENNRIKDYSVGKFFHDFLERIIKDDSLYLLQIEEKLSKLEERITMEEDEDLNSQIIKYKKEILKLYHYYDQLIDIGEYLSEKEKEVFKSSNVSLNFHIFLERSTRLQNETLLLREYAHQLEDLYKSQINIRQNNIMKILTIVTTIFLPLNLITGWYGMNFHHMPELAWEFSYPFIMIIFIIVIIICLIIFKRKKFW